MLIAAVVVTPIGGWAAGPALIDPIALLAGIGVGISSSVIPYVCRPARDAPPPARDLRADGRAAARDRHHRRRDRLAQLPSTAELAGVGLVVVGVALHRAPAAGARAGLSTGTTRIVRPGSWER